MRSQKFALSFVLDDEEALQHSALIARQLEGLQSEKMEALLGMQGPLPMIIVVADDECDDGADFGPLVSVDDMIEYRILMEEK